MKKYLEFIEGTSSKFWCVETNDNLMTITYGKIGTAGKSDTKNMPSAEAAEKEALKQANGKIKKGYVEKDAPGEMPAPKAPASQKPAAPQAPKEAAKPKRPADVKDDGQLKEWHDEDYWDACFWDADTYEGLEKADEDDVPKPAKKTKAVKSTATSTETDSKLSEDQIEYHKEEFLDACEDSYLDDYEEHIEILRPAMSKEDFAEMLEEGMKKAHESGWRSRVKPEAFQIVMKLMAEGITLPDEEDREDKTLAKVAEIYLAANGKKSYQDAVDEYYGNIFKDVAEEAAKLLRTTINNITAGKYNDKPGIDNGRISIDRAGMRIDADGDIEVRICAIDSSERKSVLLEKTPYNKVKLGDMDSDTEEKYVAMYMAPLVEEMAGEGLFNNLTTLGSLIIETRYNKIFFNRIVNEEAHLEAKKILDTQLDFLEKTEGWEKAKDLIRPTIKNYLTAGFDPDGKRCLAILRRFLNCGKSEVESEAYHTISDCSKISDKYTAEYLFENGISYGYENFNWYWFEKDMKKLVDEYNYEPAKKRLAEWEEEQKQLTYKEDGDKSDNDDDDDDKRKGSYTEDDLFRETETMIARASHSGRVNIRFKEESLQGYTDVLDYLNNLMTKGYSLENDGYEMGVYFVAKPEFPKIKFDDYMPRVPEMALFWKAAMYEELHEKIREFVNLTVNEYDHYHNLDGEWSTVCGTFAAMSAAMYDVKFMDLAIRLAKETDGEHEELAYNFAGELKKRYGVTKDTVAAIYELSASCDHDFTGYKELYTIPENLEAFMTHYTENFDKHLSKSHLKRYFDSMANNSKGVLKKIKEYFDGAGDEKVKMLYADFYNLALEILGEEDGTDYGEPLSVLLKSSGDSVVEIEKFTETAPVIITADEAVKRSGMNKSDISSTEGRAAFIFRPSAITNPYIYEFVHQNREKISTLSKDVCMTYTCYSCNNLEIMGKKWAFDLKGAACQHGMIVFDGKNEPVILYGLFDYANVVRKLGKKSTTDRAALEQLRLENMHPTLQAPEGTPVPDGMVYNSDFDYLGDADDAFYRDNYSCTQNNLKKISKDDPNYPASLLLWADVYKKRKDTQQIKRVYTELLELLPEYADYWKQMLAKVN